MRGQIKPADKETLRHTGLAHMLAISGMHIAMFAGTVYALSGLLFAFVPVLVQSHNTRILRFVIAWSFGLFYLFISGGIVAIQRAFIMMSLVFHRKISKPGETLFYEFKICNDVPAHYAGGLKNKKRIWLN